MTRRVDFSVIANVEVEDDGKLSMTLDWGSSLLGEMVEGSGYEQTDLADKVAEKLGRFLSLNPSLQGEHPVVIGRVDL